MDLGDEDLAADVVNEVDLGDISVTVYITPPFEHQDDLAQIFALLGQLVARTLARLRMDDAGLGQLLQSGRKDVPARTISTRWSPNSPTDLSS